MTFKAALACLLIGMVAATAHAQIVDPTFNPGAAKYPSPDSPFARQDVIAMAAQADGKIVIGGYFTGLGDGTGSTPRAYIGRLNADGSLDSTFNPGANAGVVALAIQSDGKILVGGDFNVLAGVPRVHLGRLNPDGSIDPTFDPRPDQPVRDIIVQPDGRILIAGYFRQVQQYQTCAVARLLPDGTRDPSFQPCELDSISPYAVEMSLQPNGDVITVLAFSVTNHGALARMDASGQLVNWLDSPGGNVNAVAAQPDGKILVASLWDLRRLNPDLTVDPSFDTTSLKSQFNSPTAKVIAVQPDGKILIIGNFPQTTGGTLYILRVLPDGSPDPTFTLGANGVIETLALRPNGDLVVGGNFSAIGGPGTGSGTVARLRLARIHPAPQVVDLNGDQSGDLLRYLPSTGRWVQQLSAGGGLTVGTSGFWSANWTISPATFNTDPYTDFFLFNTSNGQWFKMLSDGAGGFTAQATSVWGPQWQRLIVDLDGDATSDVFLWDPAKGEWFECLSNGSSGFTYVHGFWSPGWEVYPMTFNADSRRDFFLFNRSTGLWFWAVGTSGGFTYPRSGTWATDWQLYPADYNGDGLTDLFLQRPATGLWFLATSTNASDFSFTSGFFATGYVPYPMDLDGNGRSDLFLHNPSTGQWFEMTSDGAGAFVNAGGAAWSLGWTVVPTDFNADGRADVLLYNISTGVWFQARNTGLGTFTYSTGAWTPGYTVIANRPFGGG